MSGAIAHLFKKIFLYRGADSPRKEAAGALPPLIDPKVPNQQQSTSSFARRAKTATADQRLATVDRQTANLDLMTLRNGISTKATIRDLSKVSPNLSAARWAYNRMVVTRSYTAVAWNQDGTANPEATAVLQQILARMDFLTDYSQGFNNVTGIKALAESLCNELMTEGACSMELVLDKARLPSRFQPISVSQLFFFEDKDHQAYPQQRILGQSIVLDQPTFFYEALDQDLLTAYSEAPFEAGLTATLSDAEFTQDVRRVIKRALHPRLDVSIDSDKFRKDIPFDIAGDPDKMTTYRDSFTTSVQDAVNGLEPDDALVHFDSMSFDYLNNGNVTLDKEYTTLQGMINSKLATGTKAPPAVLGQGSGSANIASTETMLFIKYCEGVQNKINSILSRALTLAVRLMGNDVYVQFELDRIELRPEGELEAFRAIKQSRVLELLSLGMITDEQASLQLTGKLPPKGATPLSGTFFKAGSTDPNAGNTASAQSNTGAVGQSVTPTTPQNPKGAPIQRVK